MKKPFSSSVERREARDPLLEAASLSSERLSHLRELFEKVGTRCAERLGALAPSTIEVAFSEIAAGPVGDLLPAGDEGFAVASFHAADRELTLLVGADGAFIGAALEAVFGADGSEPASDRQRSFSALEIRLAGAILAELAGALQDSLFGGGASPPELQHIGSLDELPAAARPGGPCIVANFQLSTLERGGGFSVLVPQSAVQEAKHSAATESQGRQRSPDPDWNKRIEQELQRTQVSLQAVLDECELTLGDVAELRVGQLLSLRATPRSEVKVLCNDQTVFWCELGQTDGAYTVRVKEFADEEQELADAILSN